MKANVSGGFFLNTVYNNQKAQWHLELSLWFVCDD